MRVDYLKSTGQFPPSASAGKPDSRDEIGALPVKTPRRPEVSPS